MKKNIVECINVNKYYSLGKQKVHALKDFNYNFNAGITLLTGHSGSGKSTLLNLLGVLDKPDGGTIRLGETFVTNASSWQKTLLRREKIGFIFQSFSLISTLNIIDNIEYPILNNRNIKKSEVRSRSLNLLDRIGLAGFEKRFPRALSGGQMQRVAIARSLISNPELILADEPTANLDSESGTNVLNLLMEMHQEFGTAVVIASHDQLVRQSISQEIHLRDGVLEEVLQ